MGEKVGVGSRIGKKALVGREVTRHRGLSFKMETSDGAVRRRRSEQKSCSPLGERYTMTLGAETPKNGSERRSQFIGGDEKHGAAVGIEEHGRVDERGAERVEALTESHIIARAAGENG